MLNVRRSGSGPTLILIHGVAGSGAIWNSLAPLLEPYFDLVRLDLLGYGFSPQPPLAAYDTQCHLKAIHDTVASLDLTKPYTLVGLSMGAMLALDYAAAYPKETCAIICMGLPYYRSTAEATGSLSRNIWTGLVIKYPRLVRWILPPAWALTRSSGWLRRTFGPRIYSDQITKESAMVSEPAFSGTVRKVMRDHRIDAALPEIEDIPKLFIQGSRDQWTPAIRVRELVSRLHHARLEEIEGSEHNVAVLYPEVTAQLCIDFLQTLA